MFHITDDGVGPEILKMVLFMGLGGSSFGLTNDILIDYVYTVYFLSSKGMTNSFLS